GVNGVRAAGRRALAEVGLLEEEHLVTPGCRVDRDADPGGTAADDHHVPWLLPRLRAADHVGTIEPHSRSTIAGSPSNRKMRGRKPRGYLAAGRDRATRHLGGLDVRRPVRPCKSVSFGNPLPCARWSAPGTTSPRTRWSRIRSMNPG